MFGLTHRMLFLYLARKTIFLLIIYAEVAHSTPKSKQNDNIVKEYLAARQVYVYRAYKDMQIFHFNIPPYTSNAIFNLTSNNTDGCYPRNITVYLQAASYPVVSPDGAAFPEYAWVSRDPVYQATLLSDLNPAFLPVTAPQPGDWFMVAFIFDDSNRITQAGLFPSCYAWLQIEATYHQAKDIELLESHITSNGSLSTLPFQIDERTTFSFFVPSEVWSAEVVVKNCRSMNESREVDGIDASECLLNILLRPLALPFLSAPNSVGINCSVEEFDNCSLPFTPMPGAWHYCVITPDDGPVSFDVGVSLYVCSSEESSRTIQDPFPYIFEREFVFTEVDMEEKLKESLNMLNASSNSSVGQDIDLNWKYLKKEFEVDENQVDTSDKINVAPDFGTPAQAPSIHLTKRSVNMSDFDSLNQTEELVTAVKMDLSESACWTSHPLTRKTFPGNFVYEFDFKPDVNGSVPLMLNLSNHIPTVLTFDLNSIIDIGGTLSVDLALSPFMNTSVHNYTVFGCLNVGIRSTINEEDGKVTCNRGQIIHVNTSDSSHYSSSILIPYPEPGRWFFTLIPSCFQQNQSDFVACSTNVTTVIFSIASASCIMGKCGEFGSCFQYISGGFIFSTCVCDVGYRGYACTDGSEAIPNSKLLLSTLLLCLSNLFFIPAIVLALYRRYYTEALVYAFTMFFSTFYHACDQDIYNFCLMRLSVLQFCDFYSAILSFWVTLIAMANLPQSVYSLLHMAGAVVVALGVEYDRTGLWVFAIPSVSAFVIMAIAWVMHTKKEKKCYPPRKYWLRCLLPGTVLAAIGLICYAFLETEDNYYIIHSFWHSIMALSILCLLPPAAESKGDSSVEDGDFQTSDAQVLTVNLNL